MWLDGLTLRRTTDILEYFDQLRDQSTIDGYDCADHLPGPLRDLGTVYPTKKEILREMAAAGGLNALSLFISLFVSRVCGDLQGSKDSHTLNGASSKTGTAAGSASPIS